MSKLEKIENTVVEGYKKIENGVVGGYKRMEDGVVTGFNKIVDGFVEKHLVREGETVEEARERLAKEQDERMATTQNAAIGAELKMTDLGKKWKED